jgi:hypothetical protein
VIKKTAKGGIFTSPKSITEQLFQSITSNARSAHISPMDFAAAVLAEFARHRASLDVCLSWIRQIYPANHLEAKDTLIQELLRQDIAGKWKTLREWWTPVKPTDRPVPAAAVAQQLVHQIQKRSLDQLRRGQHA